MLDDCDQTAAAAAAASEPEVTAEPGPRELYALGQLSRILEVSPAAIRSWVQAGLLSPARTEGRFVFFDFMQVSAARSLVRLLRGGVTISQVRRSLAQLAAWMPDSSAPHATAHLQALERDGDDVVVRLASGGVAEPTGQMRLDFSPFPAAARPAAELLSIVRRSPRDWFAAGVAAEDAGDHEAAVKHYHEAMLAGVPRSEIAFNMGNALHSARRWAAAEQRFMQAVEIDPKYVEAWNNLGNVRVELGRHDAAVQSYERALDLDPSYADAHFNLAATLEAADRPVDAERHWRQYLRQCPNGPDVEFVQRRLAAILPAG